ncbi:MAG TPA: glutamate-5-semialdehyde dehydrogenase [Candidatus Hydrogenedens sp.]|nr:glutamate-5-semialdehyde dehydrogenase [Candidatus Hydrogenedens sp.]HOL19909.1 glutamate-5-semialdehyde dehydrogenase [Candidatus Hydrogenedens sp.]HPP58350.1 glutamate-5-semialdehyde dehydrogenase [Candidatus Hydrogenedens sp.]
MSIKEDVELIGKRAKEASYKIKTVPKNVKNQALLKIAEELENQSEWLIKENKKDLTNAREMGQTSAFIDRLELNPKRIQSMAESVRVVASLPDPIGNIENQYIHPNGLRIARIRQPIGVIGIIYESRPNVTIDAASLCLKSANACILRGGSESIHSNLALIKIFNDTATKCGIPEYAVQMISTTDRAAVGEMLKLDKYIDVIIPRGGKSLIARIYDESRIPVVAHLDGVCHTYLHADADLEMAMKIVINAKLQRPGVCNAMETLLVHESCAPILLPPIAEALLKGGCELRGCPRTQMLIDCKPATEEDWYTEYLDKILSIRIVSSVEEAIAHINHYGSHHSDAIVTNDYSMAEKFLDEVDSATVYVNASTRFTDGFEFGMGAEIGISTNKLHWRGPMALEGLTTFKFIIRGDGQIRE